MKIHKREGTTFLTFDNLDSLEFLKHAFSTRMGGVSEGEFSSMNLTFYSGDDENKVKENYKIFCKAVGIDPASLVLASQDHTKNVIEITFDDRGKGIYREHEGEDADGLITNAEDTFLTTVYADCVPLFFADPHKKAVAVSHAGWKGTVAGIADETVTAMKKQYGCKPEDIYIGIGPCIEMSCFEMGEKEASKFFDLPSKVIEGKISQIFKGEGAKEKKYYVDLSGINKNLLIHAGINPEKIELADICTGCNESWMFSHRSSKGKRGGMAGVIGIPSE